MIGAHQPFFSPDGKWVAYFANSEIRKIPVSGGPPVTICTFALPRGGAWGPGGTIYVGSLAIGGGIYAVSDRGGEPKLISTPDLTRSELANLFPSVLPGGHALLLTITDEDVAKNQIAVLDLRSGSLTRLLRGGSSATYVGLSGGASSGTGAIVYAASGELRAIQFDTDRLETIGTSVPLHETVTMESTGAAQYALSANGTLVTLPGGQATRSFRRSLVWIDRQGRESPIPAPVRSYTAVKLSPDGTRAALDLRDEAQDIWIWDLKREQLERFTVGQGLNAFPIWTPDGRTIIFGGLQGGLVQNLFSQPVDRPGAPKRLTTSTGSQSASTISPDGTRVLFREVTSETGEDIMMLDLRDGKVTPLFQTPYVERTPVISPDGRMVAFAWSETGRSQIYVAPFPDVASRRWQISDASTGSGAKPLWAPNGRELFYVSGGALYAVPVETTPTFTFGKAVRLFSIRDFTSGGGRYYDITPDGARFIVIKDLTSPADEAGRPKVIVTVNWISALKRTFGAS